MNLYTIGFTHKSAGDFFGALRQAGIRRLVDVRLHNSSQLAGFSKRDDLAFFLRELCQAEYTHEPLLAPTEAIFDAIKRRQGSWETFQRDFLALLAERRVEERLDRALFATPSVLLCSEASAERCHRSLVAEFLQSRWGDLTIVHL